MVLTSRLYLCIYKNNTPGRQLIIIFHTADNFSNKKQIGKRQPYFYVSLHWLPPPPPPSPSRIDGQSESAAYTGSLRDSTVQALGGPLIKAKDMTVDQWVDGVDTNLVPMDRAGDPLYFLITHQTLPDLPESTTVEVATVSLKIEHYLGLDLCI